MEKYIRITQKKSLICQTENLRRVIQGLGLRKINQTVEKRDNNCIRGMVNKVKHLVSYELIEK